jgi:hypothetical protein
MTKVLQNTHFTLSALTPAHYPSTLPVPGYKQERLHMKKIISLAAASALVLGVSVSVAPAANAACSGKLKIAFQGPLTGPEAALRIN